MRTRYLLAAVVAGLATTTASAQTQGGGTGTTGGTGGTGGITSGDAGSNSIVQQQDAPTISGAAVTASSMLNGTNGLGMYYASPQFQGRAGATGTDAPGGFGVALSGASSGGGRAVGTAFSSGASRASTTGGTTTGRTGTSAISTALGGTTGTTGLGGLGGVGTTGRTGTTALGGFGTAAGGLGGTGRTGTTTGLGGGRTTGGLGTTTGAANGTVIPLPRQIMYTATLRMPMPAVNVPEQQAELRGVLDRSSMIANPRGIEVVTNGPVVVLRGTVKDKDEAETAEGIIRLTPGVKDVKNELRY